MFKTVPTINRKSKNPKGTRKDTAGKVIDDGSLYNDDAFLDEHDPNYDSEGLPHPKNLVLKFNQFPSITCQL